MQRPILLSVFSFLREQRYLEAAAKRVSRKKSESESNDVVCEPKG